MVTEPEIVEDESLPPLPPGSGAVSFTDVRFSYHGGRDVLAAFALQLEGGESVALVGPTGCGKSTVARLVPRFYDVTAGSIHIDGVDVREVRLGSLRREIGLVFEDTFLFSDTVWENLAFAARAATDEARKGSTEVDPAEVERAARLAGADDFIRELPDGYDTLLGEHGFSLSGGQRQRLAIARAILADPRVLILDDATSAVDPTKEHEIRAALAEVMHGRTTLIIAHRPATIALADRVVLMDEWGQVAATGTHVDLLATNEMYRRVLADVSHDHEVAP
jgi:ATP-binding cassette subfamily B protein